MAGWILWFSIIIVGRSSDGVKIFYIQAMFAVYSYQRKMILLIYLYFLQDQKV